MTKIIFFLIFTIVISSCNNGTSKVKKNITQSSVSDSIKSNSKLKSWLNKNNIYEIAQTSKNKAFELWAYSDKLKVKDSTHLWYPSTDSSYYLITNFNKSIGKRIDSINSIDLRFLDTKTNLVYIGIGIQDSLKNQKIDFTWTNKNTFYFLTEYNKRKNITKVKVGVDSLWSYSVNNN